jgi:translation initiation factor IF-2
MDQDEPTSTTERPPIVAIVGHIDHGKSTLLDYIRSTHVVDTEAGGITQHLSAYEATHGKKRITFLDTPGHEAFRAMRLRGLEVADVAVLVVSTEDGVKTQTVEALKQIAEVGIPYIVALTKIDKPGADVQKAKMSLLENGIFVEGLGGEVPSIPVSGKTGDGINELLDLILLAAELEGLATDPTQAGAGLVIEAHVDPKRGNTATLIVQTGVVASGEFITSGIAMAPVRIMENFLGKAVKSAHAGSPVRIVGFSTLPQVGDTWRTVESKKEAEEEVAEARRERANTLAASPNSTAAAEVDEEITRLVLPVLIKTDFAGTADAVVHEIEKLPKYETLDVRIVARSVGTITETDVRLVGAGQAPGIIVGFNVKVEREARDLAERQNVDIMVFDIIYKLTEWLGEQIETRRPRQRFEEQTATVQVLKVFSSVKDRFVLGGRVNQGVIAVGNEVKVLRDEVEVARGEVLGLQAQKTDVQTVGQGNEFGAMIRLTAAPQYNDQIVAFEVLQK